MDMMCWNCNFYFELLFQWWEPFQLLIKQVTEKKKKKKKKKKNLTPPTPPPQKKKKKKKKLNPTPI
ncbi:hypothetical protein HanIR_Chr16g0791191 [Helianthus annuus]|nr:hypothetical protein HanIR_Chr16g0791191 [Helianthus annuus]